MLSFELLLLYSVRLKGCEGEVAARLDNRWKLVTYDWENFDDGGDMPLDEQDD
jgi:hypothetical protein